MIKAVIFDLDGTLLDRDATVEVFVYDQYERFIEFLNHIPKENYMKRFIELDDHGYAWKDKVYSRLVEEFAIQGISWEELLQDYVDHFNKHCIPFPNLLETLGRLKQQGFLLGVITNGKGQFQMDNIRALGIGDFTDTILISEWEGVKKPDPFIFEKAVERLKVHPEECVYIGDHPDKDVKAAEAVGMTGVWKKNHLWKQPLDNLVIEELNEIPGIVQSVSS
ncbi:HAD family hydrolase [Salimicrobium halophilum]|uniref:Putative hydrolase of the HAD superfamily n=1 Tax=Salimicrobium halophilum TaxID=86666 RepID=A0A1G8V8W2_9BACI|nr:HAD-IA family hydrolase [Salimicrobium halophilum]SDJ62521.1 putative hydrolase of the HAD superfamily [Salimicrobium halophilum]